AMHVKFSADPAVGFAESWLDGAPALVRTNGITLAKDYAPSTARVPVRLTMGLFPSRDSSPSRIFFYDDLVCGATLADVTVARSGPDPDGGVPRDADASADGRPPAGRDAA